MATTTTLTYEQALKAFREKEKALEESRIALSSTLTQRFKEAMNQAAEAYDLMDVDTRAALMKDPSNEVSLHKMGIMPSAVVPSLRKTRAKRVSDDIFLAYLQSEHTEADISARFGFKPTTLAQKLSRLKGKNRIESREKDGVKYWKEHRNS